MVAKGKDESMEFLSEPRVDVYSDRRFIEASQRFHELDTQELRSWVNTKRPACSGCGLGHVVFDSDLVLPPNEYLSTKTIGDARSTLAEQTTWTQYGRIWWTCANCSASNIEIYSELWWRIPFAILGGMAVGWIILCVLAFAGVG